MSKIKRIDKRFNKIIELKVMPYIAEAFCTLNQGINGNRLRQLDAQCTEEAFKYKALQLKALLNDYIDKQVNAFTNAPNTEYPEVLADELYSKLAQHID